jgi:hypothetical protein
MPTTNVMSGVGVQRDQALASGGRGRLNTKYYNEGIVRERGGFPLTLTEEVGHRDYIPGDVVSIRGQNIVPLDPSLEFAGIIDNVGEDRGRYVAVVFTRGAICVMVRGLNSETCQGMKVYALPAGHTQVFTLAEQGVLIGEVCAIENREREMAIVGFRLASDQRPFGLGGNRPDRLGR